MINSISSYSQWWRGQFIGFFGSLLIRYFVHTIMEIILLSESQRQTRYFYETPYPCSQWIFNYLTPGMVWSSNQWSRWSPAQFIIQMQIWPKIFKLSGSIDHQHYPRSAAWCIDILSILQPHEFYKRVLARVWTLGQDGRDKTYISRATKKGCSAYSYER